MCQASCHLTSDLLVELERDRLTQRLGVETDFPNEDDLKPGDDLSSACNECPLLSQQGRCSQYDLRPMMCRLWGAVWDELMICPYGCKPERYLSNSEVRRIWDKLAEIDSRYQRESQNESYTSEGP